MENNILTADYSSVKETTAEFASANGVSTVAAYFYADPAVEPKAIVQISHGMVEYIRRYAPLARYLAAHGYVVCGNDHLGHGATSGDSGLDGYFAEERGAECVLEDLHTMSALAREKYPGLPLYLLGHSMGSFFARWYAEKWGGELAGLILSGTAGPNPAAGAGLAIVKLMLAFRDSTAHSKFIENMAFGSYCKRIPDALTGKEWVTGDADILAAYVNDPKCSFTFTLNGYLGLMQVLTAVNRKEWAAALPKELPVWLLAGTEDPVGNYGAGVQQVHDALAAAGVQDLAITLYPGCRHEVHNEVPEARAKLYTDLLTWLNSHCGN